MGACPFCRGQVSQEILSNGGHCPKCLIEIPGEETATDPGELAKAHIAAEVEASNKSRRGLVIGIVVMSVLGLGGGGLLWHFNQPEDMGAYMETDDDFVFAPVGSHQNLDSPEDQPVDGGAASSGAGTLAGTSGARKGAGGSRGGVARGSGSPPTGGTPATAPEQPPPAQGSLVPSASSSGPSARSGGAPVMADPLSAFSVTGGPANKGPQGIVLSGSGEIYDMVQGVFAVKGNQMKQCYEQRLKVEEGLRGSWTASFTIQGNGRTANVVVKGDDTRDKELESCMKIKVEGWTFQAIAEPFRIDKSFRFGR